MIMSPDLWQSNLRPIQSFSIHQHHDYAHENTLTLVMQVLWHIMFHRLRMQITLRMSAWDAIACILHAQPCFVIKHSGCNSSARADRWLTQHVALKSVSTLRLMRGGFDFPLICLSKAWPPMWGTSALNANTLLLSCASQCDREKSLHRTKSGFFMKTKHTLCINATSACVSA